MSVLRCCRHARRRRPPADRRADGGGSATTGSGIVHLRTIKLGIGQLSIDDLGIGEPAAVLGSGIGSRAFR